MYFIQYTGFLVLLLHQCAVNSFNIADIDIQFNYVNREINSLDSPLVSDEKIQTRWISQEVDHFNSSDKRMWQMTYYEDLQFFKENGPIYLFLTVEELGLYHFWLQTGLMKDLAIETQGAMYCTEHRYYGKNTPFIDIDMENIKYLSSRQALADIAKLIINLKSLPMYKDSKVVVIGGSHGGNLAAWMKVLYPNIIDAAISSSAPVLAKKDFYEYLHKVKDNYEHYGGTKCLSDIEKKFDNYDMLLQNPEGINQLKIDERICGESDMTVLENQQLFFFFKIYPFISYSGYGAGFIKFHCDHLDDISDYKSFLNKHLTVNTSETEFCRMFDFNQLINSLHEDRNVEFYYKWLYQSCTEFGHFKTTTSKDQPFINVPLEFYMKVCSRLFGKNFNEKMVDEGIENSNKLYGGLKPNVTKVVFTNGDRDPLSTISVLKDLSDDTQAVVIQEGFLMQDLYSYFLRDSVELKEAREYVKYLIKKWLGLPYSLLDI